MMMSVNDSMTMSASRPGINFSGATNQGPEKGANMIIIGCDYHPGFQQIAYVDNETGELKEQRLGHPESAEKFYREPAG
jgi:hypothetical protein